jgi:hypothetical protein
VQSGQPLPRRRNSDSSDAASPASRSAGPRLDLFLEEGFGTPLFDRLPGRMRLTCLWSEDDGPVD